MAEPTNKKKAEDDHAHVHEHVHDHDDACVTAMRHGALVVDVVVDVIPDREIWFF